MVPAKETAEEQLLRMIEGPGGPKPSRGPLRGFSPKRFVEQLRERGETLWRLALPAQQGERSDVLLWRLHLAERICWVILAGLGIYLIVDLALIKRQPPTILVRTMPEGASPTQRGASGLAEDQLKPLAEYREAIMSRNPFGGHLAKGAGGSTGDQGAKGKLIELTKSLTVVGINRGRIPEALIEESTAQRTYFVKVGDQINGLTVKSIDQSGVTVGYEGEETLLQ